MKSQLVLTDDSMTVEPEVMFGGLPVSVFEQNVRTDGGKHRHSEAQLSIVTEGSVRFVFADGERTLEKGQVIFINCMRLHEAHAAAEGQCSCRCVKFNPAVVGGGADYGIADRYIDPVTKSSAPDWVILREDAALAVRGYVAELTGHIEGEKSGYEIRINILLQEIWLRIFDAVMDGSQNPAHSTSYSEKLRIDMLCDYIHKNYAEKITLEDIANSAHISKGECCRVFKRLFHTTPFQYLVYYRLSRSIELLTDTDYSISQIAQHVGFCSSSYYTKCFRKEYNCVPHKYRHELHTLDEHK